MTLVIEQQSPKNPRGGLMSTEVIVKDFESTDSLGNYLQSYTEGIIDESFPTNHGYALKVTVGENSHRNQDRKPNFQCSINLRFDGFKKVYKVTKQGPQFYDVVADAGHALKRILRRRHNLFSDHNRSLPTLEGSQAS